MKQIGSSFMLVDTSWVYSTTLLKQSTEQSSFSENYTAVY